MNFLQDIQNAIAAVENFGQHLPAEVQPDFTAAVGGLKTVANAAADAGVAVGETTIASKAPVLGPELASLFGLWADSLIAQLLTVKTNVATPTV